MDTVKILNDLLSRNYDAEKGFSLAADKTENRVLKEYFLRNSMMHKKFGHELKAELALMDGKIDKGTSLEGDLHRAWMKVKEAFSGNTDEALLEECKRGQKTAMEDYQEAVNLLGNSRIAVLLSVQKDEIADIVAELKTLKLAT